MKDFYRMANELRALLLAMYPKGYIKTTYTDEGMEFYYHNFSSSPHTLKSIQVTANGKFDIEVI